MRIDDWTNEAAPRDGALLDAIRARRGGRFINLDLALLWSEPLARGWNALLGAVRREFAVSPRVKELAICVVARLTGASYEFLHHWPEYVKAGGDEALRPALDDPIAAAANERFADGAPPPQVGRGGAALDVGIGRAMHAFRHRIPLFARRHPGHRHERRV